MKNKQVDKSLMFAILGLASFGVIMVGSASVLYSQTHFGDSYYLLKKQLFAGFLPGIVAMYFLSKIDYHFWKKVAVPFFFVTLVFLVLVFVPGIGSEVYGASRWINLGPMSFQPSEMAKLAIIMYLAAWLESKGRKRIEDFYEGMIPFLGILGVMGFLILKQPDTGTLGAIIIISMCVYFASGAKISHIVSILVAGFIALGALIKVAPYRMNRFKVFLNPEIDPQGIGYQINQALLAIGSGGFFGLGFGHSRQKLNYLPEPMGDSIFAVISEEFGFVGAVMLVGVFVFIASRGYRIAKNSSDEFGKLMAIGITSWIIFQAFINIAAITAMIPMTGIPLPFISYGGTSLVFLMSATGILLNISKQSRLK
ncbi:MAG: putative lipid II flippase FtsW [Candidatus Moranbacteria bacterium]|nr:putative lipid II flippase FtsW [Candidatus Moranbacteria bacterium]